MQKNSEGTIRENDQQIVVDNKNRVVKNKNYTIFFKQGIKSDDINVFLQKLSSLAIKYKEKHRFNTLFKAVTLEFQELSEKQLAMLKKYSEVDEIINDHTYLPLLDNKSLSFTRNSRRKKRDASSAELINLPKLSPDTDGRGTLVAVIDSGADVASPDLRLDDEVVQNRAFKYDQATMEKIIKDNGLDGIWYSDKLPYVYNYAESKTDVGGKGIEHGMHVAGIIGANPLVAKDLYARGVIPNAQLAIMRVFGHNKTKGTSSYIYLRALEDAYKIGVDAVNMSLGISAGSTSTEDTAVIKAIEELKKKGVQVAIAGGNDGYFGHNYGRPRTDMPDYGVVASPGVLEDGLTVASLENTKYKAPVFEAKGLKQGDELSYILHGTINHDELLKDEHYQTFRSIVDCGYGQENDFPANTSLKGKIAMIKRGKGLYFSAKIKNALAHEADFVMFVNDPGDNSVPGIEVGDAKVISTIILRSDADKLLAKKAQLRLANENIEMNNPTAGKLSEFSAWGFTADGQLKPDITAPGGKIWSDVGDGKRESLSGTSMATPHVAAALAIVAKRVTNDFPHIQGEAKQAFIKQLLMNTAVPHLSNDGHTFSSPRQQGAGVLNVTKALQANTVAYGTNGLASINLGNVKDQVHIELIVENKGSKPVTYNYKTYFTTDKIVDGRFMAEPLSLGTADGTSFTLEAGAKKIITIDKKVSELKIPSHDIARQGCYIDGFVVLSSADNPELSIPFSGFVGDWTNLPVIEPSIYDLLKVGRKPFYLKPQEEKYKLKNRPLQHGYGGSLFNFTHLETLVDNEFQVLGAYPGIKPNIYYSDKHLAISPNDDGRNDYAAFRATFLRSYTDCQIKVYKEKEKTPIYTGAPVLHQGYKNYAGSDENKQSSSSFEWSWHGEKDGTDRKVADGKYEFEVTVKPLADGAKEQTMRFPLTVDTIAPEVKLATWDATKRIFDLQEVIEKGSGLRLAQIIYPENNSVANHKSLNIHLKAKEEVSRLQVLKGQHGHIDLPNTNNKTIRTPQGKIINAGEVNGDHHKFVLPKEVDFDKAKLLLEDWAGNLYYQPLNASIRDDKFRIIPRISLQGDGILPAVKIEIFDEHNKQILANKVITAGRYRIHASLQNDDYQLKTPQDQWVEINETNKNAIVNIIVEKVKYYKVTVAIDGLFDDKTIDKLNLNGYKGKVTIKLINRQTKRQYLFKQTLSLIKDQLDVLVPAGEYDVSIEDVSDGWQAKASTTKLTVIPRTKPHGSGIDLSVKYAKKEAPRIKFYLQPSTDNTYTDTLIKPIEFVFTNLTTSEKTTLNYNLESGAKTAELPEGNYQVTITEPKDYELKIADAIDNKVNIKLDKFGISGPTIRFGLTKKASGKIEPSPSEKKVKLYINYSLFFSDYKDISNKPIKLEFKNNANGKTKEITYAKAGQLQSELTEGEYTVKLLEPKGYSLELNGDKQNHKLVVKYNEKFGIVQPVQMYFALHKEEQAPSPSIDKYHLTIINGHIICDDRSSEQINTVEVKAGEVVKAIADIPTNMIFTGWQVKKGNLQLENKDTKIINFKMPKEDIELVATFKSNHVDHNQTPSQIHTDTNTTPTLSSTSNNRVSANVVPKTSDMYSVMGVSLVLFFSILCLVFIYRFSLAYSTNIDLDDITINDIHHHKNRRNDK